MEKKPLNVAVVTHSYPTEDDPTRTLFVKDEARMLSELHNIEVHLPSVFALPFQMQYSRNRRPLKAELTVHRSVYLSFPGRTFGRVTRYSLSKSVMKTIDRQNPDLAHLHSLYPTGLAAKALARSGYPVVLTIHGGDWYYNLKHERLMDLLLESMRFCQKIICVGKQLLEDITEYEPGLKPKLLHLPHGIDTEIFHPDATADPVPSEFTKGAIHLLCVANLFRVKGIDLLLKAFAQLNSASKLHLHIISPRSDRDAKEEADDLIKAHGLDQHVTFYPQKSPPELATFYRAADLFISPSRKEGFGLVIAEAIACGTPVVATRSGGPEEIVTEETGLLIKTESVDELKTAIEKLLSEKERYDPNRMHEYIRNHFSLAHKKNRLMDLYAETTKK